MLGNIQLLLQMVKIASQEVEKIVAENIFHALVNYQPGYVKENVKINTCNLIISICVTLRCIFVTDTSYANLHI